MAESMDMTSGNARIIEAARRLRTSVAPQTDAEVIEHTKAELLLAIVRELRTMNLIAWTSANGSQPSPEVATLISDALGLEVKS